MPIQVLNIVEELEDQEVPCVKCKKTVVIKSFIIRESRPYKYISCADCVSCGHKDTFEDDYQVLDYGVRITCDFTNKTELEKNLRRMAYTHKAADVMFLDEKDNELFSFSDGRSNVDCIQGIWMRAKEVLESNSTSDDETVNEMIRKIEKMVQETGFKLVINDNSGYSRVAPFEVECVDIENMTFDELNENDQKVKYEIREKEIRNVQ